MQGSWRSGLNHMKAPQAGRANAKPTKKHLHRLTLPPPYVAYTAAMENLGKISAFSKNIRSALP